MINSKLTRTLRTLDGDELKRLLQFLKSPFYNANPNITNLYLLLRNHHPAFDSAKLAKETVFKKLFPNRAYDHQKLLNLMTGFTSLVEKYLVVLQVEKEELEQQKLLVRAYAERPDCYEVFEKKVWELDKTLDAQPYRDELYFREKKDLNLLYFGHPYTDKTTDKNNTLALANEHFENYMAFAEIKLKCANNAITNTVGRKNTRENMHIPSMTDIPVLDIYRKLEQFQRSGEAGSLTGLVGIFISNINLIRADDREYILKILLNYCIRQSNQGDSAFFRTVFDLYKVGLEYECLTTFGKMTEGTFQNIVSVSTLYGELDWALEFMGSYENALDVEIKEDTMAISHAQWYFAKKDFEKVIHILKHQFHDPLIKLKSKSLLIRSWFELYMENDNYLELLMAQLETLEKYARREKSLTPGMVAGFQKYLSFLKKIVHRKWDNTLIAELELEMIQEQNLMMKNWLLEKTTYILKK
ncbi:MAG: hypothetical protein H6577_18200 [Lewinellaceae bacterium]|nr:hypothetical protein [Saprospiraceae bacterium]MCB9340058.1 hypothetical protein [Lewinellaceae bacterium]